MSEKIIHLESIVKNYKVGTQIVRAIRSVSVDIKLVSHKRRHRQNCIYPKGIRKKIQNNINY